MSESSLPTGAPAGGRARKRRQRRVSAIAALGLLVIASSVFVARLPSMPTSAAMAEYVTLEHLDDRGRLDIADTLVVPLGCLVVVVVRLGLGLRMLGPFRPILIAIGMRGAGILVGLSFFVFVVLAILAVRPGLRAGMRSYYGRLSVLLSFVVVILIAVLLVGRGFDIESLVRAASVPIVVICLAAEGFARVLSNEGTRVAIWRAGVTIATAIAIVVAADVTALGQHTLAYPEIVLAEIAAILVVSSLLDARLFESRDPAANVAR